MAEPPKSLAQDLFEDMRAKVDAASKEGFADADESTKMVEEIETMCMNCHDEHGTTRLLLTRIPFFREVVIMSFQCEKCGFQNSEVQFAGEIQERGTKITFKVEQPEDLNRQVVKSDTCSFRVEELDFEIPPGRGQLSNVEGIISMAAADISLLQDQRKEQTPEVAEQLEAVIKKLQGMASGTSLPFTVSVDDPAGNSWIQFAREPPDPASKYVENKYARSQVQNAALGLTVAANGENGASGVQIRPEYHPSNMYPNMPSESTVNNVDDTEDDEIVENQVYSIPGPCPGCTKPSVTNMKMVRIPHFKEVVIMATTCDHCGYRTNEVKTGGEVPEKGRVITLKVEKPEDMSRDILKSETCELSCPDINLLVQPGTLGGRFTTVEGLLRQIRNDLHERMFSDEDAGGGDSMAADERQQWEKFFTAVDKAIEGNQKFTIILKDPFAASYVQSLAKGDGETDSQITSHDYERSEEEEEELGLRDIRTEGYEQTGVNGEERAEQTHR